MRIKSRIFCKRISDSSLLLSLLQQSLIKAFFACIIVLGFYCSVSIAHGQSSLPSPTHQPKSKPINVQEVRGKKGLRAWMVETHDIPVVSVALAFKNAGNASDPKGFSGLTYLLSSTLDEGAGNWDSQEFKAELLKNNIELTIASSQDFFQISIRAVKKNIHQAFHILKDILTKPRFDKMALIRVKNQILTILEQSLHSERTIATNKLNTILFANHPYGTTVQQTLKEFSKITDIQLRQFMKDRFAQDQLIISIVGDISANEVKDYLDTTFGDLPPKAVPYDIDRAILPKMGTTVIEPLNIPQSFIRFAQPGIPRSDPNFYPAFLLLKILGEGQYESRLWNEIREKRGLTYDIDANLTWSQHSSLLAGDTSTKSKSVKEMITLIRKIWTDMAEGATQAELDFIKKRLIGSFALNFSSTMKIAKALLVYQIDNLGLDYINKRNEIISAVTLKEVNAVAKTLLKPDQLTFVIVGDPKELSSQNIIQGKQIGASS